MTVIESHKDLDRLTLTFVTEFDASFEQVWQLWADQHKLERWWGPPTFPATFTTYEFTPGGTAKYYMTGPDGSTPGGWWKITAIDEPHRLELDDGFSDEDGNPLDQYGTTHVVVTFESLDSGTRMTITSHFESREQLEQMAEMGMQEGMSAALGQMDAVLAESLSA